MNTLRSPLSASLQHIGPLTPRDARSNMATYHHNSSEPRIRQYTFLDDQILAGITCNQSSWTISGPKASGKHVSYSFSILVIGTSHLTFIGKARLQMNSTSLSARQTTSNELISWHEFRTIETWAKRKLRCSGPWILEIGKASKSPSWKGTVISTGLLLFTYQSRRLLWPTSTKLEKLIAIRSN